MTLALVPLDVGELIEDPRRISIVAKRIAARPEAVRWDPVVCIGEDGRDEGVVRPQRLLCALAEAEDADAITKRDDSL